MGTSNAVREAKKKEKAQEQIDANLSKHSSEIEFNGVTVRDTPLSLMDAYSTKFMTAKDQLLLAIDKIDAPEVKAGMTPQEPLDSSYLGNGEFSDYATRFSLNDGDSDALRCIKLKLEGVGMRRYHFDEPQEDQHCDADDYVLVYMNKFGGSGVRFSFDLYDGGELSGSEDVPSVSALIELSRAPERRTGLLWEYVIVVHSNENKKPKDALIKSEYLKMQEFMRSIAVSMGILPTNL